MKQTQDLIQEVCKDEILKLEFVPGYSYINLIKSLSNELKLNLEKIINPIVYGAIDEAISALTMESTKICENSNEIEKYSTIDYLEKELTDIALEFLKNFFFSS